MLSDLEENGEEGRSVSKQSKKSLTTFAYIQAVFGCVCVPMMYCILFGVRSKKWKENKVFLF